MTPPRLAGGHGNIYYVGLTSFILEETQFYLKKKKTNKKETKSTQTKEHQIYLSLVSALNKKLKKEKSCLCPLPPPPFLTGQNYWAVE